MLNLESWAVESGMQLKESGIPLTIAIQNQSSTDKDWNPVSGNLESTAWNPESKTVLDSLLNSKPQYKELLWSSLLWCLTVFYRQKFEPSKLVSIGCLVLS